MKRIILNAILRNFENKKIKNLIILLTVSLLASQVLFLIHVYGVNLISWDELDFVPFVKSFYDGKSFWLDSQFLQHFEHRHIFPALILLSDAVLTSWNSLYEMYLGWCFIAVSLLIVYLMLKNTDTKLLWLLIPISAFMFNVSQYANFLVGFWAIDYFLTTVSFVLTIYFLNKSRNNRISFLFALVFAILASYSEILGLLIWVIGIMSLFYVERKRTEHLLIWLCSSIVVIFLYFTNYTFGTFKGIQFSSFFSLDSLKFILLYLSNGLSPNSVMLQIVTSSLIILSIIGGSIYLKIRKIELTKILPWIQLGLFGLFAAFFSELARLGIESPLVSRWVTLANFSQISALVIGTIVFIQIYSDLTTNRKKIIILIIYSILLLFGIISLSISYYVGWNNAFYWFQYRSFGLECMTNPSLNLKCGGLSLDPSTLYLHTRILQDLHLGPFAKQYEILSHPVDPLLKNENWENMTNDLQGDGHIDYVDKLLTSEKMVKVNKTKIDRIRIDGWAITTKNNDNADSVYILIDNKISNRATYYLMREDIPKAFGEKTTYFSGWSGVIDLKDLSKGCHNITIRIVKANQFHEVLSDHKLCMS